MFKTKCAPLFTTTLLTLVVTGPALADDSEIFFGASGASDGAANILLVLDTSGSMDTDVITRPDYDPDTTYTGNCSSSYVYFKKDSYSSTPSCNSGGTMSSNSNYGYVASGSFYCSTATTGGGAFETAGFKSDYGIRWTATTTSSGGMGGGSSTTYAWDSNMARTSSGGGGGMGGSSTTYTQTDVACNSHVDSSYPNGVSPTSSTEWTTSSSDSWWNRNSSTSYEGYIFYNANYLNYLNDSSLVTTSTRLEVMQAAANSLLDSLSGVKVGVMRYDAAGNGGMVTNAVQDVATGRSAMQTEINSWTANGNTPLSETLHEAYLYYAGQTVNYGDGSYVISSTDTGGCTYSWWSGNYYCPSHSVAASRVGNSSSSTTYQTPMEYSCQKNYLVFLTDGLPTSDSSSDSSIEALDGSSTGCYSSASAMWSSLGYSTAQSSTGLCLKELARYMYENDLSSSLSDTQNVTSYFIGFGDDVATGFDYLEDAGNAGGGGAYTAGSLDSLSSVFNEILGSIRDDSATFTTPSVAVNAFNKKNILEDLYISVFAPSQNLHWDGNLKKYKLSNGAIQGQNGDAVNSSTGFFNDSSQSYWSTVVDGSDVTKGGAASLLPAHATRNVYTYIGSNPSSATTLSSNINHSVETGNTNITTTMLGVTDSDTRANLINWARGQDLNDEDSDDDTTDTRHVMGDPVHAQPNVVIYGGDEDTATELERLQDAVVYLTTNDGYLHAIDVTSGVELWSFIPQNLLGNLVNLYDNPTASSKFYSLDGNLRTFKYDVDGDGIVEPADNDKVILYFSQGRGGDTYYALDITYKTAPKFMWSIDSDDLAGLVQQSWSTPVLGRVRIDGATQNSQRYVLIFAGGYDDAEESATYNSGDTYGRGIFMVDALRGTLLWHAGPSSDTTADLQLSAMTHAIPSNVTVMDTNSDGWTDRMYVGDLGGQVWRFDITSGNSASSVVAGGVIASLGGKAGSGTTANNRSFFNAPDVAKMVVRNGANYYNISIGSGDRALPKSNMTTEDRFYALRDYQLSAMTQDDYDDLTPIYDSDLVTIDGFTTVTLDDTAEGWKLPLTSGEKVLAESTTTDKKVQFTSWYPQTTSSSSCVTSTGVGRSYIIEIGSGLKYLNDESVADSEESLYEEFATTGLPSQTINIDKSNIISTEEDDDDDGDGDGDGDGDDDDSDDEGNICLNGVTILDRCVTFGSRVKTFWTEAGAN